ncbi:MAG TPA: sigma-70 family RNA polymerase sigma factor [Ktedonobacterales bacterium]|nr:sigma-70 family RNA polymerase sigma factor [Ktedonobacterales bacterium]
MRRGEPFAISSHPQPSSAGPAPHVSQAGGASATPPTVPASFDDFYARHEQPLYGYLRRLLPSHEVAVEVAQEAFFRAWRQYETLRAYERPEAWLYRVATNLAISQLRRRAPLSFSSLAARQRAETPQRDELAAGELFASGADLERDAAERDVIERILRALPERHRAALLLSAQGFKGDEIAAALGATPANARQMLRRARERFRSLYDAAQMKGE